MKNVGNADNIIDVMKRAAKGEQITIGFIGGSITQGAVVSDEALCYAARVFKWWKDSFPAAKVRYVNAGIGATTSQFGAARVSDDLLKYEPDFVIVEYSVNDNDDELDDPSHDPDNNRLSDRRELFRETYEGLIRRILSHKNRSHKVPAILIVHSVKYDNGNSFEDVHAEIGRHYGIPCISMKENIYDKLTGTGDRSMLLPDGKKISINSITEDMLHPNDLGHAIVAGYITDYLNELKTKADNPEYEDAGRFREDYDESEKAKGIHLPAALTLNMYEDVVRYNRLNASPVLNGFTEDDSSMMKPFDINTDYDREGDGTTVNDDPVLSSEVRDVFKNGWRASKEGDSVIFEFTGSELALMYRRTVNKPAPVAYAVIDGDEENRIRLDGNFDEDWGDKACMVTLMHHGRICENGNTESANRDEKRHKLTVTIGEAENCVSDFYLINLVGKLCGLS